jgi:putative heme transporter
MMTGRNGYEKEVEGLHVRRNQEDSSAQSHRPRWIPSPRLLIGVVILVAVAFAAFHAGSVSHDASRVFRHFKIERLPWLGVALGAELLSFLCYAFVQHGLLADGGAQLRRRDMIHLAVAATGLANLLPGGTAPSSGWLVSQYRKRGVPMPLALWAVLAGGFAATVSVLLLTLAGAAVAELVGPLWIGVCFVLLVAGAVAFLAAVRHLDAVDRWFRTHHHGRSDRLLKRFSKRIGDASKFRATPAVGVRVLLLSIGNWGLDVGCLIAAFPLLGLSVPWSTVLFAYAFAQIAGSLAPVPGGIGFVEGGMVGAFALAGTPVTDAVLATILYRLITTVGMAGLGSIMLVYLSRQKSTRRAVLSSRAAALEEH